MPAGVNLSQYMKFFVAAMFSMMAGSQVVHIVYHPLDGLDLLVQQEMKRLSAFSPRTEANDDSQ